MDGNGHKKPLSERDVQQHINDLRMKHVANVDAMLESKGLKKPKKGCPFLILMFLLAFGGASQLFGLATAIIMALVWFIIQIIAKMGGDGDNHN